MKRVPVSRDLCHIDLDIDQDGMIAVAPLTGFGLVLLSEEALCVLRVEFASTPEQRSGRQQAVQLALTSDQALCLARELNATVAAVCRPPSGTNC